MSRSQGSQFEKEHVKRGHGGSQGFALDATGANRASSMNGGWVLTASDVELWLETSVVVIIEASPLLLLRPSRQVIGVLLLRVRRLRTWAGPDRYLLWGQIRAAFFIKSPLSRPTEAVEDVANVGSLFETRNLCELR